MCNGLAAKVRAAVAGQTYDAFHKQQAKQIRKAIFGANEFDKIKDFYDFETNGLRIMNVDIYSVQPESKETQILLKKSVIQSIKIQTDSFEAGHRHEQMLADQRNQGLLNNQKIKAD